MTTNKQIYLYQAPTGQLREEDFKSREVPIPVAAKGQILVKNILVLLSSVNRAWIEGPTYMDQILPGSVMAGEGVAVVIESKDPNFDAGDIVFGMVGWQEYAVLNAEEAEKYQYRKPFTHLLSLHGLASGLTAYHGIVSVGAISEGETLVVSAAAGSVGNLVGQIGKIKGATVIGIAGGAEKCNWLVNELGYDAAIDYKNTEVETALQKICPDGIDVYFDNVGGDVLQAALFNMKYGGRIICCGAASQYEKPFREHKSPNGLPVMLPLRSLTMKGFMAFDFPEKDEEAHDDLARWVKSGVLKAVEDVMDGLEFLPKALIGLLDGENRGTRMVRIAADPQ